MHDLNKLYQECLQDLAALNIVPETICSVTVNTRSKTYWGWCKHRGNKLHDIEISKRLLADHVPERIVKQTICHEILHACPKTKGHTGEWKRLAHVVNNAYGYNITRTNSFSELSLEERPERVIPKYRLVCTRCGYAWSYHRRCYTVDNWKKMRCNRVINDIKCGAPLMLIGPNGQPIDIKHEAKYRFKCNVCGQIVERQRKSKFTENYRKYTCGVCNTKGSFRKIT